MHPDMLVNTQRIHPHQTVSCTRATFRFSFHWLPEGVPGDAELIGQCQDRGVQAGESASAAHVMARVVSFACAGASS